MFEPSRLAPFIPFTLAGAAVVFGANALILMWRRQIAGATLSATAAFLSVVLAYFPQLDSISAWNISVKLGRQIDQAKELLERIKSLSDATATASYYTIAWEGRWADQNYAKQKKRTLDSVVGEMKLLDLPEDRQTKIAAPLMGTIAADLIHIFYSTLTGCPRANSNEQQTAQIANKIMASMPDFEHLEDMRGPDMRRLFEDKMAEFPPESRDVEPLRRLGAKLSDLLEASRAAHNYTDKTADLLDEYMSVVRPGEFCVKLDRFR